jgi:hypothetical protein
MQPATYCDPADGPLRRLPELFEHVGSPIWMYREGRDVPGNYTGYAQDRPDAYTGRVKTPSAYSETMHSVLWKEEAKMQILIKHKCTHSLFPSQRVQDRPKTQHAVDSTQACKTILAPAKDVFLAGPAP